MSENSIGQDAVDLLARSREQILDQLSKVIVGQQDVIEQILISMFSRGHCLLEGVPGLAKTLMISTLANCLDLEFNRIQFTPDLMPADITGTEIIEENKSTGARERRFMEGPLFSNVVLADEINRASTLVSDWQPRFSLSTPTSTMNSKSPSEQRLAPTPPSNLF
jgi:MoxR-like ATPase